MPLVSGKAARTRKGFSKNVEREMRAGKPQKQAVKIAYVKADEGIAKANAARRKKAAKKSKK